MEKTKRDALVESLVALERQAKNLEQLRKEGARNFAGLSVKEALALTAKALILDSGKLQDMEGATEWNEQKKQLGLRLDNAKE